MHSFSSIAKLNDSILELCALKVNCKLSMLFRLTSFSVKYCLEFHSDLCFSYMHLV